MKPSIVHLHLLRLDKSEGDLSACRGILSPDEARRADRFALQHLGNRWLVSRAGLKDILAHYCDTPPRDIRFGEESNGKPVLEYPPWGSGIYFNLSHSGTTAAVAVTSAAPVGVDVEQRKAVTDWQPVATRFFSSTEYRQLIDVPERQLDDAFLRCWTRKEAVIKATGEGLSADLTSFDVSLGAGTPARVLRDRGGDAGSWQLRHFEGPEFIGAVAIRSANAVSVKQHGLWSIRYA